MAKQLSQELVQGRKTILRLGIMSTISPDEIVDLIASLRERHPGVDLRVLDRPLCGTVGSSFYAASFSC